MSIWPKQIEEERRTEYRSDENPNEDVVGSYTYEVVVVYRHIRIETRDVSLLGSVIYLLVRPQKAHV